jgi:SAM-dependent methyltransferase
VFVDPRPADSVLSGLYDEDFYVSTGWPFRRLAERLLPQIQRTRQRRVERFVPRGSLLDAGSGDGRYVQHMAGEGWQATGLDFSAAAWRGVVPAHQPGGSGHEQRG